MKILVLAPHADDEVLGMGGTIAKFAQKGCQITVSVLTGHGDEPHPLWASSHWDEVRNECQAAAKLLGVEQILFRDLPAACLDFTPVWKINNVIADLVKKVQPQEIYVPFEFDLHKDHAATAYGLYVAARPYLEQARCVQRILAYETLSETHLMPPYFSPAFQPNVFVDIENTIEVKLDAMRAYRSQLQSDGLPRSIATLKALATLRGAHIGANAAEAFILLGEYVR